MPLNDIVIDTNILMHANNSQEPSQADCINLIQNLLSSEVKLCLDEGLDVNEAKNKSRIWHEYMDNLRTHGTTGRSFLEKILQQKRIKEISKRVTPRTIKLINQTINHDKPVDKIFIKVTCNSGEKLFVTHDTEDFPDWKRVHYNRNLNIKLVYAHEIF